MDLFDDEDDPVFRQELEKATEATSAYDQPGIARLVELIAEDCNRAIKCLHCGKHGLPAGHPASVNANCHAYSLDLSRSPDYLKSRKPESDFVESLLESGILVVRPPQSEGNGDIVLYRSADKIAHSGVVSGDGVVSKWGGGSVFRHSLFAVPYEYGSCVSFYAPPDRDEVEAEYRRWFEIN